MVLSLLFGCTGDDGATGSQGDTGSQGPQGNNGQDGKTLPRELSIEVVGRFTTNIYGKSAAEIIQFHQQSQSAFAINAALNHIEVIDLTGLPTSAVANPIADASLNSNALSLPTSVSVINESGTTQTISLGEANSIAIYQNLLAVAVQAADKVANGAVLFYQLDTNGNGSFINAVKVGALPDMLTFTHDGNQVLVANEGEPNKDYSIDPEGSISLISVANGTPSTISTSINFTSDLIFSSNLLDEEDYDTDAKRKAMLSEQGVKFASPNGTSVAQDIEPEYITIAKDNKKAFVSLQENNAIGIIDLESNRIEIRGLGYKDWSKNKLDYSNKDNLPNLQSVDRLFGLYQPDSIAAYEWNGATFIASANEGDAREYIYQTSQTDCLAAGHQFDDGDCIAYSEEARVKDLKDNMTPALSDVYAQHGGKNQLGRLKITTALGQIDTDNDGVVDRYDNLFAYGARSFSIWDENANQVFDSADDFEKISAAILGKNFNSAHTENKGDNRSDDKGGEPEAIAIGNINDRTYAFIALERSGDLFIYDITNPFNSTFTAHHNNRDFSLSFELDDDLDDPCDSSEGMDCSQVSVAGDLGPESIQFVAAENSPNGNPLLIIGNEVSGSVTVYQILEK